MATKTPVAEKAKKTKTKEETPVTYYEKAKVTCACGNTFTVGATRPEIDVEICSDCHPFYTGQSQTARGSRIERFQKRLEKTQNLKKK